MRSLSNNDLIKLASYFSVTNAAIILLVKVYGWLATDSQAMLASLIDSMLDISSSFINLIAIKYSLLPPDSNHRFGHEKFQDLAIFAQSIFFFASSLFALFSSAKALIYPTQLANLEVGANVMYICLALTLLLVLYQSYVISKTKSHIIAADKLHYFSDFLANIVVIISIKLSNSFWFIDALFGIGISLYIMLGSYKLFRHAIRNLSDEEFEQQERQKIIDIISTFKEVKGLHDLKTRYAGNKAFIQFHLEIDPATSLLEAHELSDRICLSILKEFPGGEVIIHQDPAGLDEPVGYREQINVI